MRKFITTRIDKSLYDFLHARKKKYGTSLREESANLVSMTNVLGSKLGIDLKEIPIQREEKISLDFKKKVFIFK